MTGDKAVELINEWLNLAKEIGDMNLNRMEYDEERYNYAMDRMDVIRQEINEYHKHMNECKKKEGVKTDSFFICRKDKAGVQGTLSPAGSRAEPCPRRAQCVDGEAVNSY